MFQQLHRYYHSNKTRIGRLLAEGGWLVAGQIASLTSSLVLVRVLTEYLEPAQYGQLCLGLTLTGFVNQTIFGGIIAGIGRYYSIAAEKNDVGSYLIAARYFLIYATAVISFVTLIIMAGLYWLDYSQWIGMSAAALAFSVLSGYNSSIDAIQSAARRRAVVAFHCGMDAWLRIVFAISAMQLIGATSTAVVTGYACSSLVIAFSQRLCMKRAAPNKKKHEIHSQKWARHIRAYSLPFTVWGGFTWMQQVSDRWALQEYGSANDVGQYAVLFQLGYTPVTMVMSLLMGFLGPILYQRSGDATDPGRNTNVHVIGWRITYVALIVTLFCFAATSALHEWIFSILVAQEYRGSSQLLPWVVLAGGIFSAGQMLALKLMSEMKSSAMTTVKIVTALIGALLNLIGSSVAGVRGVVAALVAFSIIYFFCMAVLGKNSKQGSSGV